MMPSTKLPWNREQVHIKQHKSFVFISHGSGLSFLHQTSTAQWMTACLFVIGLKEAEPILMRSEYLLSKVTPTGLACADPTTHKVRLLTGNTRWFPTGFQIHCHPMSETILITISETATRWPLFLPPADPGGRIWGFLKWIDNCNFSF